MLYAAIVIGAVAWVGGFIGMFRQVWVRSSEPWYGKLFAYILLFFGWPFVLLYMQGRE